MIEYTLHKDPYDAGTMFTGKLTRTIKPRLTILVGCNGSGKTTTLWAIKEKYVDDPDFKVFSWDGLTDKSIMKQRSLDMGNIDALSMLAFSSEGEEINGNVGLIANQIGNYVRNGLNKDVILLLDGADSGLSVDNIIDLKRFLKELLIPDIENAGHKCYVIIPANEYELVNGEECIDVRSGKVVKFTDYEEYRKFILKSRELKDKR